MCCDHFQSDPPGVGYVFMDVTKVPCKGTYVATSSLGVDVLPMDVYHIAWKWPTLSQK
jgi:hypothetical protein